MADMSPQTEAEQDRDQFFDDLTKERVVMLTDRFAGEFNTRPMTAMVRPDEGCVYFLTSKTTVPDNGCEANPNVVLSVAHTGTNTYMSLYGLAARIDDPVQIARFWSPPSRAFFTGPDDPDICLLRIYLERAEVWRGDIAPLAAVKLGFAALTGARPPLGTFKDIDL
jgi:general stress protein 26